MNTMKPLILLFLVLLTTPLTAAPPAGEDASAPSFYIEEILVEGGKKVSPGIIVAESLLKTGESYTEDDLRDAVHRIQRLPFLLSVDFELRKGTERGRYVLVIEILETTRFFYGLDLRGTHLTNAEPSFYDDRWSGDLLLGYRYFVGNSGLLYLTIGDFGAQLGYSSYNFLGRNLFLDVAYILDGACCSDDDELDFNFPRSPDSPSFSVDRGDRRRSVRFTLGIPRSARQLWRIDGRYTSAEDKRFFRLTPDDNVEERQTQLAVSWIYDTTDDPLFPSDGDEVVIKLSGSDTHVDSRTYFLQWQPFVFGSSRSTGDSWRGELTLDGRRYWRKGAKRSLMAGFGLRFSTGENDLRLFEDVPDLVTTDRIFSEVDAWAVELTGKHAIDLVGAKRSKPQRRLRWETGITYSYGSASSDVLGWDGSGDLSGDQSQAVFFSDMIYRGRWGVFRVGLRFIDILEGS